MGIQTVIIIRHAEHPPADGSACGVCESGAPSDNQLSVRGWQRAGALALFFATPQPLHPAIVRPTHLFAASPHASYSSRRNISTLLPLARLLRLHISQDFTKGEEAALARHVDALDGTILIAWEHDTIPKLADCLVTSAQPTPDRWPDDRFDLVWTFTQGASGIRRFTQFGQTLLAGDEPSITPATGLPCPAAMR